MSPRSNPKAHYRRHFSFYILHRYLGLLVVLFVLLLAITGIMLNHTETLHLDEQKINSTVALGWYGIDVEIPQQGYRLGENWVSHSKQSVFFNDRLIELALKKLTGAISTEQLLVISGEDKVALLTQEIELVDVIDRASGLPDGKILNLGFTKQQQVALETDKGIFIASPGFLSWQLAVPADIEWPQQIDLPVDLKADIAKSWRGEGVTLERLILDLHSGRLFGGNSGVLLMDLAAIIMILLALTGIWLWVTRWRKRAAHIKAFKSHHPD